MRLIDADAIEKELGVEDRDLYVQHILDSAPTIEAEPIKHGRWVKISERNYKCSICNDWWSGEEEEIKTFNYCPNCGAKMDEVTE